jgi:hypothetical protein
MADMCNRWGWLQVVAGGRASPKDESVGRWPCLESLCPAREQGRCDSDDRQVADLK